MPVSINNTTLTFNNGTTQTTAPVNTNANVNSVSAGTGISVSATTGALTVTNSGVTSVNGQTGAVSVSSSSGTVTSVATGNGLTGGTITSSGTLSITAAGYQSVGSYMILYNQPGTSPLNPNTNYSGTTASVVGSNSCGGDNKGPASGTWRCLGVIPSQGQWLGVRVS